MYLTSLNTSYLKKIPKKVCKIGYFTAKNIWQNEKWLNIFQGFQKLTKIETKQIKSKHHRKI